MLQIPITNKSDQTEALKLQRRLQYEEDRKKRIFNAKQRLFGLDLDGLERQIADKKKQRNIEAECERRYEELTAMRQNAVRSKELELEKRQRVAQSDLNYYRCRFQRPEDRREFDLNDPDGLRKAKPMRVADDDDLTLGISSAQVFHGEDLGGNERKQRQRAQQRAWLDQQIQERKNAENARRLADRALEESMYSRDKRLEDMAKSERRVRDQVVQSIREYNSELARRKRDERQRNKKDTNEDDMAEIYNMLTSDMLTENPDVAQSRTNPNKKIAFMYRGMTPDELAAFREEQGRQIAENRKRAIDQQLMDKQWEQYALNMDHELLLKEREMERKRRGELDGQLNMNAELAKQQRVQRAEEAKHAMKAGIAQEFYEQFNRTSR